MPLGVNLLFRLGRKLLAAPLEDSGLLPGKYYRSQALEALEENDFPECLRYLKMAEVHRKTQARMVAQLLILRCRLLLEEHKKRAHRLEENLRLGNDPAKAHCYRQVLREECKAQQFLNRYIREAQLLVKTPEKPIAPSHGETRPA
jgi:hypothetical protein